jgi:Kef-type K+ transport system membrane component KefB
MHAALINDIAICMMSAFACAVIAQWLKQPAIIAYIIAGAIAGPLVFGWVHEAEAVETISELGLIFLLFMIGLEIDLKKVLKAGRIIAVTALLQIVLCFLFALAAYWSLGQPVSGAHLDGVYLALAATFSSTIIIVKLLYDKRELETLPGRVTLGVLVLQDLAAILFLALQPQLANPTGEAIGLALARVAGLVITAFVVSRFALPPLFRFLARQPELVLVGALAWCFAVSWLAAWLGLSREMGALIAGVALSTFPYTIDVAARVNTLRDFFVTLFFVSLGMQIPAPSAELAIAGFVLAAVLVATRALAVFPVMYAQRLGFRISALTTINLSQVSEFSLVIAALGFSYGHINKNTIGVILYAFSILAVLSSYAIINSDRLTRGVRRHHTLNAPEHNAESGHDEQPEGRIFILGFYTAASSFLTELTQRDPALAEKVVVVDFNPVVGQELVKRGVRVVYGDISRPDTLTHAGLGKAAVIIGTLPDTILKGTNNLRLTKTIRGINPDAQLIMHAEALDQVDELYKAGASYVVVSRLLEADHLCDAVSAAHKGALPALRESLSAEIKGRHEVLR